MFVWLDMYTAPIQTDKQPVYYSIVYAGAVTILFIYGFTYLQNTIIQACSIANSDNYYDDDNDVMHTSASRRAHKWSQEDGIPALQDILKQVSELSLMWADSQNDFIGQSHTHTHTCTHAHTHTHTHTHTLI